MKLFFTTICVLTLVFVTYAQPAPPANPVPLGGGIGLLIAAGAALGGKKIYEMRNKN